MLRGDWLSQARLLLLTLAGLVVAFPGCGGSPSGVENREIVSSEIDSLVADLRGENHFPVEVLNLDEWAVTPELPPPCLGFGQPAETSDHCCSGILVEFMDDGVCTETCVTECPLGWTCTQMSATDPVWVCMSDAARLCRPCEKSSDCEAYVDTQARCVAYGPEGSFCGAGCGEKSLCPEGFACEDVSTVAGEAATQCIYVAGECPCGPSAVAVQASTLCQTGNEWGTCTGQRECTPDGLSPCDAMVPAFEACDDFDNDCDGEIDEDLESCCECGNGLCEGEDFCGEISANCCDCVECGDGICNCGEGESGQLCALDCCGSCGDAFCASFEPCNEDCDKCSEDCCEFACGDSACLKGENPQNCPQDCPPFYCGNYLCEPGEVDGPEPCPGDCEGVCGNCVCDKGETGLTCVHDCYSCGDGYCSSCPEHHENLATCFEDCSLTARARSAERTAAWGFAECAPASRAVA